MYAPAELTLRELKNFLRLTDNYFCKVLIKTFKKKNDKNESNGGK